MIYKIHLALIISLLLILLGAAVETGASEVKEISYQANDWFAKYEFRSLALEKSRNVENVIVFFRGRHQPEKILQSAQWQQFAKENGIGLVSLDYSYQEERKAKNGKRLTPLYRENPQKASQLLERQLLKEISKQFPKAKKYGFIGGQKACTQSLRTGRKSCFWVAENVLWKAPEKPHEQPMGLSLCSDKKYLSRKLEIHGHNRDQKRKITFANVGKEDSQAVESFIGEYALIAFASPRTKGRLFDVNSKDAVKLVTKPEQRRKTTWLPDHRLVTLWKSVHHLTGNDRLADVLKETVETGVKEQPHLNLYVKFPRHLGKVKRPRGVLCIATWQAAEQSMMNLLRHKTYKGDLIEWAERHQYAVVTWNTVTLWKSGTGQAELESGAARIMDRRFDQVASAWKAGMRRLAKKYDFPEGGYFIYGISRGSHWGHRLVLRNPQLFQAAHFHVPNSYDIPTSQAKDLLWMVTTGERDGGYQASMNFYKKCRSLGYPITIKAAPTLGHSDRGDIIKISHTFFDYAHGLREIYLKQTNDYEAISRQMADQMRKDLKRAEYVGDLINQGIYPTKEAAWIPVGQRIPMVSKAFGEVWGELQK